MPSVLLCAPDPFMAELHGTLLWRDDVERHLCTRFEEALTLAVAARPDLVVIDREWAAAERLVKALRQDPATREVSIAVVAGGELDDRELQLLHAGANAVLRLPPGPEWDERLGRLVTVPRRKEARVPVHVECEIDAGAPSALQGEVVNVSTTGMLLAAMYPLAVGQDVDLGFALPPSPVLIRGTGRVVRQAGPDQYGIEFYALEGDGPKRVSRFVKTGAR